MIFKIFPATITPDNQKIPLIKNWKEEATNNPEQIRQWQEFYGSRLSLWGAPCGSVNNIFVLDIDNKPNGVNGFESLRNFGINELPNTAYQMTPSQGMHLIFKDDAALQLGNTVDRDIGIDSRCNGGWIGLYDIKNIENISPIPNWVFNVIKKKPKSSTSVPTPTGVIMQMDPSIALNTFNQSITAILNAGQGERNHTLNTHSYVIGKLVANGALSHTYAYDELTKAALKIGLDQREAHATIMSGLGSGEQKPIVLDFGSPTPNIKIPEAPVIVPRDRWTPKFADIKMLTDWTKLKKPQLFENWSTEDIHLTSAIGGVGKTTLKLFEAICLALGEPFLGFKCLKPGRTLFIIGEDSEEKLYAILGKMCKQLGFFNPENEHKIQAVLNNIVIKRATDLCLVQQDQRTRAFIPSEDALIKIKEAVDDLQPRQIVIDPIAMFWGSEAGGNDMAMGLAKAMIELQTYSNASIDMITHIGKDSSTKKDVSQFSGRGGTALPNHSRVVRTLLKLNTNEYREESGKDLEEGKTAIYTYVSKFSDGSPLLDKPFIIVRDGYTFERVDCIVKVEGSTEERVNLSEQKEVIYNFLKANSSEAKPITEKELARIMVGYKIPKGKTSACVSMLKLEGVIEELNHSDILIGDWLRVK